MVPPPPPRLSITTGWPSASLRRLPMARPTVSIIPPAAKGTTMRTGLDGYAWPSAASGAIRSTIKIDRNVHIQFSSTLFSYRSLFPRLHPPAPVGPQLVAQDLATIALRQLAYDDHVLRHLGQRQASAAIGKNVVPIKLFAWLQTDVANHLLAIDRVRHADRRRLNHLSMRKQNLVDLLWRNIDAAADDDL